MIESREHAENLGWYVWQNNHGWNGEKRFPSGFMSRPVAETEEDLLTAIDEMERRALSNPKIGRPRVIVKGGAIPG